MAYEETLRGLTQKWRDLHVISLRIAGKSPWLRDESVTAPAGAASAKRPIGTATRGNDQLAVAGFGSVRE
jgi:hypothetical protein